MVDKALKYMPEIDLWANEYDELFVENQFDPNNPIFLKVTGDLWQFGGQIDWVKINLPLPLKDAAKQYLLKKLKVVSEHYISKFALMLHDLALIINAKGLEFDAHDANLIFEIWGAFKTSSNKIFFREMYKEFSRNGMLNSSSSIYFKLKQSKVRKNVRMLKNVVNWHPTQGALTPEEENLVRDYIENNIPNDDRGLGVRLFAWLLFSTLKRGKQIRELEKDCLKCIENDGIKQCFVQIKPVKGQTGDPLRWWPIPRELYEAMIEYSKIPTVKNLQSQYGRFFVMTSKSLTENGVVPAAESKSMLQGYFEPIISPRTNDSINVTPTRIRHTGATRLAYSGVSRDIIAEILEHDCPDSCQSYIDAIGSELCPQINAADRNMGNFFKELNHVYFNGKIVNELSDQPIMIPLVDLQKPNPLFVGSCGLNTVKEGACHKHPFIGCYNGCPSFLAWREADHRKALSYVETEIDRWKKAAENEKTETTIKEFQAVRDNILTVIANIESGAVQEGVESEL